MEKNTENWKPINWNALIKINEDSTMNYVEEWGAEDKERDEEKRMFNAYKN